MTIENILYIIILERLFDYATKGAGIMTQNEMELLNLIRDSDDPERAMQVAVEIICQYIEQPLSCQAQAAACLPAPV